MINWLKILYGLLANVKIIKGLYWKLIHWICNQVAFLVLYVSGSFYSKKSVKNYKTNVPNSMITLLVAILFFQYFMIDMINRAFHTKVKSWGTLWVLPSFQFGATMIIDFGFIYIQSNKLDVFLYCSKYDIVKIEIMKSMW